MPPLTEPRVGRTVCGFVTGIPPSNCCGLMLVRGKLWPVVANGFFMNGLLTEEKEIAWFETGNIFAALYGYWTARTSCWTEQVVNGKWLPPCLILWLNDFYSVEETTSVYHNSNSNRIKKLSKKEKRFIPLSNSQSCQEIFFHFNNNNGKLC